MFVSSLGLAPYFNYRFCHPLGTPIKPSYPRKIDSANGTKKCVPFLAAAIRPGRAATHLQVENKSAFFDFAGQQKSAGLMVDETNKPAHCFLYIIFRILAPYLPSNRALKRATRYFVEGSGVQTLPIPLNASKISFFAQVIFRENRKATPPGTLGVPPKISRLVWLYGDPSGIRTPDPLLKRQLLCQLS